jgi:hypothetical protein
MERCKTRRTEEGITTKKQKEKRWSKIVVSGGKKYA